MRYRFGDFLLSPARRALVAVDGRTVALIPRYFDLLVLLIEQRDRAVTKQEIFERVWADVVVSDSALTQAIRSIRLALGDDPRESRFVRTVSRRGYQFIFTPVAEEDDAGPWPPRGDVGRTPDVDPTSARRPPDVDPTSARRTPDVDPTSARRPPDVGPTHAGRPPDVGPTHAGRTPDVGPASGRQATDEMALATGAAALSTAVVGALAGVAGGLAILALPGSQAESHVALTFALVGALAGALGGGGVGLGIALADALGAPRITTRMLGGALNGLGIGWLAHRAARAVLAGLFGRDVPAMGGPLEGLVLGAAVGFGYAVAVRTPTGDDPSRGWPRWRGILTTALVTGSGGVGLSLAGGHFVGASLDLIASTFAGSQVGLEPLARLLGEARLGPVTRLVVSAIETTLFGGAIAYGLTRRRRRATD